MALMFRSVLQSGGGAELIVTCDSEFAGATISCSDGTTTLNKTCPVSSPYEVTFKIPNSGDWTVSSTVSGTTYSSDPISVDLDYETDLEFGFNWKRWVDTARFLDSTDYSTLSDLLADEEAVRELCTEHACVDYLCTSAVVNPVLTEVIGSDLFAKWVNNSDYALDKMYANAAIKTAMDTADKYGYGEWALMPQVPTMTSRTAPYGNVIAPSDLGVNTEAWRAFDGGNYCWYYNALHTIGYQFVGDPIVVKRFTIQNRFDNLVAPPKKFNFVGSNDGGTTWVPIKSNLECLDRNYETIMEFDVSENETAYQAYGIQVTEMYDNVVWISEIQFYAWQPKGNVPVMTSNSAPYGEASASSVYGSGLEAYKAFDGNSETRWGSTDASTTATLTYKFTNPICAKRVFIDDYVTGSNIATLKDFEIQASNDGFVNDVHILYSGTENNTYTSANHNAYYVDITNDDYYLYYRLNMKTKNVQYGYTIWTLQFYGRELSVSVPKMATNTTPYGEASASSVAYDLPAWKAFDGDNSSYWVGSTGENQRLTYRFTTPTKIKMAVFLAEYNATFGVGAKNCKYQYSDDGENWNDVPNSEFVYLNQDGYVKLSELVDCGTHLHWAIYITDTYNSAKQTSAKTLQFYGLDYSEKEFEEGTTKKWLYDHGVELETLLVRKGTDSGVSVSKDDSQITCNGGSTNNTKTNYASVLVGVDTTNYDLIRMKTGNIDVYSNGYGAYLSVVSTDSAFPDNGTYSDDYTLAVDSGASTDLQNNYPNNRGLSVESVNQACYIVFGALYRSNEKGSLKELWLE